MFKELLHYLLVFLTVVWVAVTSPTTQDIAVLVALHFVMKGVVAMGNTARKIALRRR